MMVVLIRGNMDTSSERRHKERLSISQGERPQKKSALLIP